MSLVFRNFALSFSTAWVLLTTLESLCLPLRVTSLIHLTPIKAVQLECHQFLRNLLHNFVPLLRIMEWLSDAHCIQSKCLSWKDHLWPPRNLLHPVVVSSIFLLQTTPPPFSPFFHDMWYSFWAFKPLFFLTCLPPWSIYGHGHPLDPDLAISCRQGQSFQFEFPI